MRCVLKHGVLLLPLLLCGCLEGVTGPRESASVRGTYTDSAGIILRLGADSLVAPSQLQLHQSPNSGQVTGSIVYAPIPDLEIVSGEIKTPMLVLVTRTEETDANDCHLYTQEWELRIHPRDLNIASVRGVICEGDDQGGHVSLTDITGSSGRYVRRQ